MAARAENGRDIFGLFFSFRNDPNSPGIEPPSLKPSAFRIEHRASRIQSVHFGQLLWLQRISGALKVPGSIPAWGECFSLKNYAGFNVVNPDPMARTSDLPLYRSRVLPPSYLHNGMKFLVLGGDLQKLLVYCTYTF